MSRPIDFLDLRFSAGARGKDRWGRLDAVWIDRKYGAGTIGHEADQNIADGDDQHLLARQDRPMAVREAGAAIATAIVRPDRT